MSDIPTEIRLYGADPESIVDGPGLRFAIFTQGCSHACPGCHNPESHPFSGGKVFNIDELVADVKAHRIIKDVTLTGGDPFEQAPAVAVLAKKLRNEGYNLWAFTGFLYEDLWKSKDPSVQTILDCVDVLVDGPYIESLRSLELQWKGSSNQRVIDLAKMREAHNMHKIILWSNVFEVPPHPRNW